MNSERLGENLDKNYGESSWDKLSEVPFDGGREDAVEKNENPDVLSIKEAERAFDEYVNSEVDLPNEHHEIVGRSAEITKFEPIRPEKRSEDGQYVAKKGHYFVTGLFGPENSLFNTLAGEMDEDDVYTIDRTGDFSMEHALNGILENAKVGEDGIAKDYEEIEIITISIASGDMGKVLDERKARGELPESGPKIKLTYIDPFDKDYFAFGGQRKDSLGAKITRAGLRAVGELALLVAHPFRDKILHKGGPIFEPTSIGFLADQFAAIGRAKIFDENGRIYGKEFLTGALQAGKKENTAKNRDEFMDVEPLRQAIEDQDVRTYEKRSTHGVIDTGLMDRGEDEVVGDEVEEAYRKLHEGIE